MDLMTSALSRLEWRLKACFCSNTTLADFSEDDYFWSGQNIRGRICLELGAAYDVSEDVILDVAALTQLLHDASLIHDDLIDEDSQRRGCPAIWKKYGKSKALLIGDLLIAKAYEVASDSKVADKIKVAWTREISSAVSSAISGAVEELEFDTTETAVILDDYFRMASHKTGALFALPARCITHVVDQTDHKDLLSKIFLNLAVAYQIKDDQSDFLGTKSGRAYSSDLKNARPNLYHMLGNTHMSTNESFSYISDYHQSLVADSIQLAESLPGQVCGTLKELLFPFIELQRSPSSSRLLPVGS